MPEDGDTEEYQYCEDGYHTKGNVQIPCNSHINFQQLLTEIEKKSLKISMFNIHTEAQKKTLGNQYNSKL